MKSVGIIIENSQGELLHLLRDDNPNIPFPNQWVGLGGIVEKDESFEEAIQRELKEEIGIDISKPQLLKVYNWPEKTEAIFYTKLDLDIDKIQLKEGQRLKYFSIDELQKTNLAFHDNQIVNDFLNSKK